MKKFDPQKHIRVGGLDGVQLAKRALATSPNLIYYLPRNLDHDALLSLLSRAQVSACSLQSNYLNGKLKAKTLYIGPLFSHQRHAEDEPSRSSSELLS